MHIRSYCTIAAMVSLCLFTPRPAHTDATHLSANRYEVASYCNEMAVQRLYTVLSERYDVTTREQYSILDEQFNNCLQKAGYHLNRDAGADLNL